MGGEVDDPFTDRADRGMYSRDFDTYSTSDFSTAAEPGFAGFGGGESGGGGASSDVTEGDVAGGDFSEADGESLDDSGGDFEDDMSAS